MKILVLSDSHGRISRLQSALTLNSDADAVVFCGDGLTDIERMRETIGDKKVFAVRGNCDYGSPVPQTQTATVQGCKIAMLHGNTVGAKFTDDGLRALARDGGYDIVFHGHTHIPRCDYINDGHPFYLFNPGAVADGSFGVAVINNGQILLSHGSVL